MNLPSLVFFFSCQLYLINPQLKTAFRKDVLMKPCSKGREIKWAHKPLPPIQKFFPLITGKHSLHALRHALPFMSHTSGHSTSCGRLGRPVFVSTDFIVKAFADWKPNSRLQFKHLLLPVLQCITYSKLDKTILGDAMVQVVSMHKNKQVVLFCFPYFRI